MPGCPDIFRSVFRWGNGRVILASLLLCGLAIEVALLLFDPSVPLLPPHRNGAWIREGRAASVVSRPGVADNVVFYRKRVVVAGPPRDIAAEIAAFRTVELFLDARPLPVPAAASWKERARVVLPSRLLAPGPHEILLKVRNRMGPALAYVGSSDLPALGEAGGWEFSYDATTWKPAADCDTPMVLNGRSIFPTVLEGLRGSFWLILPLVAGTLVAAAAMPHRLARLAAPGTVRLLLLSLWLILGLSNLFNLPIEVGFDPKDHIDYCDFIIRTHRLPTAADGPQMFQPPLYYLLTALLYSLFNAFLPSATSLYLLRVVPLACGLLLVDLTARTLRLIFPDREDLQSCGLLVGALLPMNIYICQYFGNEPLTAVLTALFLYLALATFRRQTPIARRDALLLGAVGGLAMLAKATPALAVPVVLLFLLIVPRDEPSGPGRRAMLAGLFLLAAGLVSGWFYARNWLLFGKPFVGGWDPLRGISWWQDPGYRTVGDFLRFGEVFRQPIYAAFNGLADGVYSTFFSDGYLSGMASYALRPRWDYTLLAAAVALSVAPALAIGIGAAAAFRRGARRESWPHTFLLSVLLVYLAAFVHLYASLPVCSTSKGSYLTGLTPAFGALAASGAGLFLGRRYVGPVFVSLLVTWGAVTYLSFFAR